MLGNRKQTPPPPSQTPTPECRRGQVSPGRQVLGDGDEVPVPVGGLKHVCLCQGRLQGGWSSPGRARATRSPRHRVFREPELKQHHRTDTTDPPRSSPAGAPPGSCSVPPAPSTENVKERCLKEFCPSLQNMCSRMNLELRDNKVIAATYHERILSVTFHLELAMFIKSKGRSMFCEV